MALRRAVENALKKAPVELTDITLRNVLEMLCGDIASITGIECGYDICPVRYVEDDGITAEESRCHEVTLSVRGTGFQSEPMRAFTKFQFSLLGKDGRLCTRLELNLTKATMLNMDCYNFADIECALASWVEGSDFGAQLQRAVRAEKEVLLAHLEAMRRSKPL